MCEAPAVRLIQGLGDSVIFQAPLTENWFADHQRRLPVLKSLEIEVSVAGFANKKSFTGLTLHFRGFFAAEAFAMLAHAHKPFKFTQA